MKFLKQFLALACRFDFNFSCVWLSSSDNALADAASCFAYTCLFNLAPYLDKTAFLEKPSKLVVPVTCEPLTNRRFLPLAWPRLQYPNHHTAQIRSHSLNLYSSTTCTTPTGQFFPHHSMQSCSGLHPWAPEFSPNYQEISHSCPIHAH